MCFTLYASFWLSGMLRHLIEEEGWGADSRMCDQLSAVWEARVVGGLSAILFILLSSEKRSFSYSKECNFSQRQVMKVSRSFSTALYIFLFCFVILKLYNNNRLGGRHNGNRFFRSIPLKLWSIKLKFPVYQPLRSTTTSNWKLHI